MLNNFIYAKTKDLFIEQLEANQILDEAIVFIEDTKEIWNHGTYFAGISDSGLDQETIDQINAEIENVRNSIPITTSQLTNDSGFLTEHQDISHKQDVINDLDNIRQKANSALQNVPDEYITETELNTAINSVAFTEDYGSEVVMPVSNIVSMSQEEYDALTEKNPNTIYLIV